MGENMSGLETQGAGLDTDLTCAQVIKRRLLVEMAGRVGQLPLTGQHPIFAAALERDQIAAAQDKDAERFNAAGDVYKRQYTTSVRRK